MNKSHIATTEVTKDGIVKIKVLGNELELNITDLQLMIEVTVHTLTKMHYKDNMELDKEELDIMHKLVKFTKDLMRDQKAIENLQ